MTSAHHKRLDGFVGGWAGDVEIFPSPWSLGGTGHGTWHFRWDAGGANLVHTYREVRSSGSVFEGNGVLAVDPEDGRLLWFWFDNLGFPPTRPAVGRWSKDSLTLVKHTPRGMGRSIFRFADDALHYSAHVRPNGVGESTPVVSGIYRPVTSP